MKLQIELEDLSQVRKRLHVEVPVDEALQEYQQIVGQFRAHVRLPGFRPGKAPLGMVKSRFKKEIEEELHQKLVPKALDEAIRDRELKPLSIPDLQKEAYREGDPFVFWARLDVRPEFELPDYRGLKVEAPASDVTEEESQQELQRLRESNSSLVAVEGRSAEQDDFATVKLQGLEADAGEGAAPVIDQDSVVIRIGHEQTLPEFTRALVGLRPGDEETVVVEHPQDFNVKQVAGKRISYRIKMLELKRRELPELDDDFAKDLGEYETLGDLRQELKKQLQRRKEAARDHSIRSALAEKLAGGAAFEVPEVLTENQIDLKVQRAALNLMGQGINPQKVDVDWNRIRESMRSEAETEVRLSLILSDIARRESLEVSDDDVQAELKGIAEVQGVPLEKARQEMRDEDGGFDSLRLRLLRRRAMDLVVEGSEIA